MNKKIVGDGDIASALKELDRPDLLFFASGVSNSKEKRESEYQREKDLLLEQDRSLRLVYFGSLSIFYGKGRYVRHKKEMEELVISEFPKYCIIRLGNIDWGTNPNTLINALRNRVANNEPVEIRDVYRYIVSKDEFLHWISRIPDFNVEVNIPGRRMLVKDIFKEYVL